ncbi:MAG: tryptophan synthase subunit alpha [Deltaproteobacteria bacterium]|nr:tryptophan synthase subunit alpha [Deltaproteobacteria bacterium]
MSGRIGKKFIELQRRKEKALVVYLTAGDPDLETTYRLILELEKSGVDILEIGVPFSDPTADGPIIQAACLRALRRGTTLSNILHMVKSIRKVSQIPVVLFGYYNPIFSFGNQAFAREAKLAGVDGILVVDLPPEESQELRQYTDREGLDFISLIAPTTDEDRIKKISKNSTGFLYYISVTGVTGTATPRPGDIKKDVERIRDITPLPLVVGFGISTPRQAREIAFYANGVVIGSAFVKMIEEHTGNIDLEKSVSSYAEDIKMAL